VTLKDKRERMVIDQLLDRGIKNPKLLEAMANLPRHRFVLPDQRGQAYMDMPLSIGHEQTISQPYMVALMVEALQLEPDMKVLEVGTGSGYQTAVLSFLGAKVFSIERIAALAEDAQLLLKRFKLKNIQIRIGDGTAGWPEEAPFDRIIVSAAAEQVPQQLKDQLSDGGRLVMPVGQNLTVFERQGEDWKKIELCKCSFVPLVSS